MSYDINEKRTIAENIEKVKQAAISAIKKLEGKIIQNDSVANEIQATFPKKILGKLLGDRSKLTLNLYPKSDSETELSALMFPIDPVGKKLLFGVRKGVSETVLKWFFAHLDDQLSKQ